MSSNKKKKTDTDKTKQYKTANASKTKVDGNTKKIKTKKKGKAKKIIVITILVLFLLFLIGGGILAGIIWGKIGDDINITKEQLLVKYQNTTVLDKDGNSLAVITGDENREVVSLDEMSKYLPDAFIAIEDKRFENHHGVDIKRTLGATATFIFNRGESSYGGSTITQQLVKYITTDKEDSGVSGVIRKVKEMAKAYQIENMISKDQIIELYLNAIPMGGFGKEISGVQVASKYYFDKNAIDLSLAESAYLAGINHAPNLYNPFLEETDNSEKIKNRTKTVLNEMQKLGKIETEEEYNKAIEEVENGLAFRQGGVATSKKEYSFHTQAALEQIIEQLAEENNWDKKWAEKQLYGGGYTIYTTQDTNMQHTMEEEYKKDKYIIWSKKHEDTHVQSAMVIIDHKTGQVVATVGKLGENADTTGVNLATQGVRHPGSAIKPIADILPGLENGIITAATVYDDSITRFNNGKYRVTNSTGYLGIDTITHGIERSSNIMATKVMAELGPLESIKFMRKLGVTTLITAEEANGGDNDETLSTAMGGLTQGISPLEMAGAYAAIANDGTYIEPTFYTKVVDSNGNTVMEPNQRTEKVFSEQNAFITKMMLENVVTGSRGTATYCKISGIDTAAKTGTSTGDADRWVCGFTPYYTAATWYGYADDREEVDWDGTNPAGLLWREVMRSVHKDLARAYFEKPDGIVSATICRDSGKVATESCSRTESVYFAKGTVPGKCDGHVKLEICKQSGKIANEFCPKDQIEEKTFLDKPEKEKTNLWQTDAGDKYSIVQDVCNVHTKVEVTVPSVINLTETQAKQKLTALKLKVEVKYKEDKKQKDGIVLQQSVEKNKKVEEGTTIVITVNKRKSTGGNTQTNTTNTTTNTNTNTTENTNTTNTTNTQVPSTNTQTSPSQPED